VEARCQHVMIDGSHHVAVEGAKMVARSAYGIDSSIPMFVLIVDPKELGVLRMGIRVCTGVLPLLYKSVRLMWLCDQMSELMNTSGVACDMCFKSIVRLR
jgi:hypothetical protein